MPLLQAKLNNTRARAKAIGIVGREYFSHSCVWISLVIETSETNRIQACS